MLHLGHLLSFDLNDRDDIVRGTKDANRKANYNNDLYFSVLGSFRNDLPFHRSVVVFYGLSPLHL